jgi:putative endonuclease
VGLPPCTGSASRRSATARRPLRSGRAAERRALRWYRLRGWKILGANVWAGGNELDLIARRGRELRFVEVKEKSGAGFGDPLEMVTAEKRRRIRRAAAAWLAARPECGGLHVGFDVVAVRGGRLERVRDAFE